MRLIDAEALKADYRMGNDCNDCPTAWKECQYNYSYTKMDFCGWLDDAPTIEPEQRWIPVNEKLPEDGAWCLFTNGRNISVERYKKDAFDHFLPEGRWFDFDEAVAWMPLPEQYKRYTEWAD